MEASLSFMSPIQFKSPIQFVSFKMSVVERVERPNTLIATIPEEFSGLSHAEIALARRGPADGIIRKRFGI